MYKKSFILIIVIFGILIYSNFTSTVLASTTNNITISISNLDKTDNSYIENTFYEILNSNNNIIYSFVSKKEPYVIKEHFNEGKYKIREIKAANGYKINKNETYFEIDKNTKTKDIKIYSIMESEINVPSTASFKNPLKYFLGFVVIIFGAYLIKKNNMLKED